MKIEIYVRFYNRIDIENFIHKYPETIDYF